MPEPKYFDSFNTGRTNQTGILYSDAFRVAGSHQAAPNLIWSQHTPPQAGITAGLLRSVLGSELSELHEKP
jgi:hypothetical protein